jgi:predicted acetyltransferase
MDQIRHLKQEELFESLTLSEFAFQHEISKEEKEERITGLKPEQVWGYFVDEKLAAKLMILNFHTWLNGKSVAMGGIAGVATWPEFRRKGMVEQLLKQALKEMKAAGQSVSFLHPFDFAFYRKFGWETYIDYSNYEISTGLLPRFEIADGAKIERIDKDWELLNGIYESYAKSFNGMLKREKEYWIHRYFRFKKGHVAIYRNAHGEVRGYLFYQVADNICTVHELVFLDEEARRGLWKFIADHDSMVDKVMLRAPSDDKLPFLLSNPRIKHEIVPYFMARIVDLENLIRQYPFANAGEGRPVYLQVSDAQAEWNNGVFKLMIDGSGQAEVVRLSGSLEKLDEMIQPLACDIQTASSLFMGYQKASFLHQIGRLKGDEAEVERLEKLIPERTTYLSDFF